MTFPAAFAALLAYPQEEGLSLELSKEHTYDEVCESLAAALRREKMPNLADATHIRLTAHNCYSQSPKPNPIKFRGMEHLSDMLLHYNQVPP